MKTSLGYVVVLSNAQRDLLSKVLDEVIDTQEMPTRVPDVSVIKNLKKIKDQL